MGILLCSLSIRGIPRAHWLNVDKGNAQRPTASVSMQSKTIIVTGTARKRGLGRAILKAFVKVSQAS